MAKSKQKFLPTVSVIVPMYNVEDYIAECLQSLLNQTLENIEVIVVDDCSTDNSVEVVKKFLPKFGDRLNLISLKPNTGCASVPRNFALNAAKGKYIYFLDSDDFIDKTALEDFYKIAEEFNADVVHSEKCFIHEEIDGKIKDELASTQTGKFVEEPTFETSDIGERVNAFIKKRFLWWGCNKLFRRDFLIANKIQFPQMTSYEDLVFSFCCLITAKNYVRVPFVSYHYRIRKTSLSHQSSKSVRLIQNLIEAVKTMDHFMKMQDFFIQNHSYRYAMLDFFIQIFIESVSENLFIYSDFSPSEIYSFLSKEVFSVNAQDNVALTSYLFVNACIYKLLVKQQAEQIAELQNQLAISQK